MRIIRNFAFLLVLFVPGIEIIGIDHGSKDASVKVASKFMEVRMVNLPGLQATFQTGYHQDSKTGRGGIGFSTSKY